MKQGIIKDRKSLIIRSLNNLYFAKELAMLHASTILLQSNILDNQAIIKRYLSVVDEVLKQLQTLKIDVAVTTIVKNIPNYTQLELIENLISLCRLTRKDGTITDFDTYAKELLAQFSINEQFCILAHTDLSSVNNNVEDVASSLALHFYDVIHNFLVSGAIENNGGVACQI